MQRCAARTGTIASILLPLMLTACKPGLDTNTAQNLAAKLEAPYDYYINGLHTERFDSAGKRLIRLTATRMNHFAADDHAELESPEFHWFRDKGEPWVVSAKQGNIQHLSNNEEITLTGDVKATTTLAQSGPLLVQTASLHVVPAAKTASTDAVADITNGSFHQRGTGMQVNLSNNTISLLKDVRGTYAH